MRLQRALSTSESRSAFSRAAVSGISASLRSGRVMAILLKKFGSNTPPLPSPFPLSSRREWQEKRGRGVWPRPNRPDGESGRVGELPVLVDIIGRIEIGRAHV